MKVRINDGHESGKELERIRRRMEKVYASCEESERAKLKTDFARLTWLVGELDHIRSQSGLVGGSRSFVLDVSVKSTGISFGSLYLMGPLSEAAKAALPIAFSPDSWDLWHGCE